jgi:hypothetical protein
VAEFVKCQQDDQADVGDQSFNDDIACVCIHYRQLTGRTPAGRGGSQKELPCRLEFVILRDSLTKNIIFDYAIA